MSNLFRAKTTQEQSQIKESALWIHKIMKVAPGIKFFNFDFIIFEKNGVWYLHELTIESIGKDLELFE